MPDALARALAVLQRRIPDTPTVYAFGSAVRGEENAESDFDLAFLAAHPLAPAERFALQEAAAAAAGRDVDLVDLRAASTVMQAQVVSTGRVVLDPDPAARAFWETMVYSAYALLNEERAGILADIAARGTVYAHG